MSFRFDANRRAFLEKKDISDDEIEMLERVVTRCLTEPRSKSKVQDLATLEERLGELWALLSRLDPRFRADLDFGVKLCRGESLEQLEKTLKALQRHVRIDYEHRKPGAGRPREYDRWYSLLHALDYIDADAQTKQEAVTAALEAAEPDRSVCEPDRSVGERARHAVRHFSRLSQQDHIDKLLDP